MHLATSSLFWGFLGLWSLVYAAVLIEATKRLRLAKSRPTAQPTPGQSWLLVRPLCGPTRDIDMLAAVPKTDESLHVLFLAAADDAEGQQAAQAAVRLCTARGQSAQWLETTPGGPNGKAVQLAQIPAALMQQAFVLSLDDDINPTSVHLGALQAALQADAALGAVWLPFVAHEAAQTFADRLAAQVLNCSPHALQILAGLAPQNLTGKVLAYRPALVAEAGGWGPRAQFFGDDLDMGQALDRVGAGVAALPHLPATTVRQGQTMRQIWQRHRRWARIIVDQKPILVPSYFWFMGAAPLAAGCWLAVWFWAEPLWPTLPWLPLLGAAFVLLARLRLMLRLSAVAWQHWPQRLGLNLLADALLLIACVAALTSPKVTWRGREGASGK